MARPITKINLNDLIAKNIKDLQRDSEMIERIELKIEEKHLKDRKQIQPSQR